MRCFLAVKVKQYVAAPAHISDFLLVHWICDHDPIANSADGTDGTDGALMIEPCRSEKGNMRKIYLLLLALSCAQLCASAEDPLSNYQTQVEREEQ